MEQLQNLSYLDMALVFAVVMLVVNDYRLARRTNQELDSAEFRDDSLLTRLQCAEANQRDACSRHDQEYSLLRLEVELPTSCDYIRRRADLVRKLHHDTTTNQELLRDLVNLAAYGRRKGWEC